MASGESYPVRVEATLDPRLSRWLWLVKWLLVIPHYIIVGIFAGGGTYIAVQSHNNSLAPLGGGLVGFLALVAVIVLLFTGQYPQPIFNFILGMDRWVIRVGVYAAWMTDKYPPFRLDMGGQEPALEPAPEPAAEQAPPE